MSAAVYVKMIIGVKIPWSKIFLGKKKIKLSDHDYPEDWDFDPKSGKLLWREESIYIDHFDNYNNSLLGYSVIVSESEVNAFISLKCIKSEDLLEIPAPIYLDINNISAEIAVFKQKLESIGLWDEKTFGV